MSNLKIAMLGLRGIPARSGGVETVVENLAPLLVKEGLDVTVFCRNPYSEDRPKSWKGVHLKYLPTINTKHTEAIVHTNLGSLRAVFSDYGIIHYHAMGNGIFSIIPRLAGKKTVVTLHGLDYEREKWGLAAKAYLKASERAITIFPNAVTSVSKKIQKHYSQAYGRQIHYIPNGVPLHKERPLKNLKRFGLMKRRYILFLSRIVPEKGLHYLIDAFSSVNADIKLLVAGDAAHTDSYAKNLKEKAKADKRIIFAGPLYGQDKEEAYSNALLFVLPSTIEGMPIVLLEAMSCACPVLASGIEENIDAMGGHGFTFRPKSVPSLKEKLITLIRDKSMLKRSGMDSKRYVRKEFRWEKIARAYAELYKSLTRK